MQTGPANHPAWTWDEMLRSFAALGGVCKNIVLREGPFGRGLFAVDPSEPVSLRVPDALLIAPDEVEFVEGSLRLKPTANATDAQRAFFDRYQDAFSWGGGGSAESADFIASLDRLPADVREVLTEDFGFEDLFEGDPTERAQSRFLATRTIQRNTMRFLVPVIELANHDSAGLTYQFGNGAWIEGQCAGEVLASYVARDPIWIFRAFGFASPEPSAFSLPVNVTAGSPEISIHRDFEHFVKRAKDWAPQLVRLEGTVHLSNLLIGHRKYPHLPRGVFRTLMREAEVSDADDRFDRIVNFNWRKILNLLAVLEPYHGEMITALRRMARYQLEAMSRCIGAREMEPEAPVAAQEWQISIE